MNILPETVIRIAEECSNVAAVKEACGNISQIAHLFSIKPSSLKVYSGNDDQTLPIMALGGDGVISVFSNAYPSELKKLAGAVFSNELSAAQELSNKYLKMMNLLFVETSPSPIKFVMSKLGLCENVLRLPLTKISRKNEELIEKEMKNYSLTEVGV
jgi:4-hydroxy-tetrahydrodipicolinate synthase